MARRRRQDSYKSTTKTHYQRVHQDPIATAMLGRPLRPIVVIDDLMSQPMDILDFYQPPARVHSGRSGFSLSPLPNTNHQGTSRSPPSPDFATGPVQACVQRHQRREVLHALNLTTKGARARRRRRTAYSEVKC